MEARKNLGVTLTNQDRLEEAIVHFSEALKIRPHDAETNFNMGNAKANMGSYEGTAAYFAKALQINPQDSEAPPQPGKGSTNDETSQKLAQRLRPLNQLYRFMYF